MPERGVFTEDFLVDLERGHFDLVVHSWKDLPLEERPSTSIVATLARADQRDLLLVRRNRLASMRASRRLVVLSSSPRREYNLTPFLKQSLPVDLDEICFQNVRGNVPTRIQKLLSGEADALVLAKAAIDRLLAAPGEEFAVVQKALREQLAQCVWQILPLSVNPTAAAQGALAIEIRRDRHDLIQLFASLHCREDGANVLQERAILGEYGGGCHQKIGVSQLSRAYGQILFIRGCTESGIEFQRHQLVRRQPPVAGSSFWPQDLSQAHFFGREELPVEVRPHSDLWIARSEALPSAWMPPMGQLVWTAGVKSWVRLAARGVWVHGCSDGLGEDEDAQLDVLLGRKPAWVKLTHQDAPLRGPHVATYRLVPRAGVLAPSGYRHYFWMSGSQFDRAVQMDAQILEAHHACGPGHTLHHLQQRLGPSRQVDVYLSFADFKKEMLSVD
jgi:hydroxymethylbilane synthase